MDTTILRASNLSLQRNPKYIDTKSDKGLTGKSAALTIKREFPEFVLAGRVFVIKSEGILP